MNYRLPISVLLPVFNADEYLKEAVESILSQSFSNFELLIIDDGSTDNSMDIASAFEDKRIRLFRRKHQGLIGTLNFGLEKAEGDWIARMDADDIALPDRLKLQQKYVSCNKDVVAVGGAAHLIGAKGIKTGRTVTPPNNHKALLRNSIYPGRSPSLIHPTVMMKTEIVRQIGGYRKEFPVSEDTDVWLRLSRVGRLHSISEPVLLLRKHNENVSHQKPQTQMKSHIAATVCHLVWQETGIDLVNEMPEKWILCSSILDRIFEKYEVTKFVEFRSEIARQIKKKTLKGCASALYNGVSSPGLLGQVLFGNIFYKVAKKTVDETMKIINNSKCHT